jgi:hypothetical protein
MEKKSSKLLSYLLPTFSDILWIAAFFRVLYVGRGMMNADGDLAMHLNIGRYILDHKIIPLQDVFSHTLSGMPVTQHEWLTTVIFALAERLFGFEGLILLCGIVIATAFWFVYKRAEQESKTFVTLVFVVFLAIMASMVHWLARPHIFSFLFLAVWMTELHAMRKGKLKRWWVFPVLMLFWVNMHGAFIVGFIALIVYGVGVAWDLLWRGLSEEELPPKRYWLYFGLSGVSSFAVSLLNPSGFGLWVKVVGHAGNKFLADNTVEFQSPNFHWTSVWPFLIMIVLLILGFAYSKKRVRSEFVFTAVAWLALGLYGARNIPLFAITAAPLLVLILDDLLVRTPQRFKFMDKFLAFNERIMNVDRQLSGYVWPILAVIVAIVGSMLGFRFYPEGKGYDIDSEKFPTAAVDWLEENPQEGEMFNLYSWGGYLEYRLWPEKRIFIDSKADFFGEDFIRQYQQVLEVQDDWEEVLNEYDVDWVILPPDELIVKALEIELDWQVVYKDDVAVILVRP